jgi:DNA-binding NtrC family response regulator
VKAKKVLLIDDEPEILEILASYLELKGFLAVCAASAREGIAILERESADGVVTDLRMPDIGGDELLEILHQRWPDLPVIVISGFVDEEMRARLARLTVAVIEKPIEKSQLMNALAKF